MNQGRNKGPRDCCIDKTFNWPSCAKRCYYKITNFKLLKINSMLWRVSDDYLELESFREAFRPSIQTKPRTAGCCWSLARVWAYGVCVWKWEKLFSVLCYFKLHDYLETAHFLKQTKLSSGSRLGPGSNDRWRRRRRPSTSASWASSMENDAV